MKNPAVADLPQTLPPLFAAAAVRAKTAGFDGVELHYAHAYTMSSFLSATNTRTDGYGGGVKERARLPLEVYEAVRGSVGPDYTVGCRFLSDEIINQGSGIDDACSFAQAFAAAGMDFLSLSRVVSSMMQSSLALALRLILHSRSGYECMPAYLSDEQGPWAET